MALLKDHPLISSQQISLILKQLKKCICKVYAYLSKHDYSYSTGFFCFIPLSLWNKMNKKTSEMSSINYSENLPVLIVNNHLINETFIKNNETITLEINNEKKMIDIKDNRIIYTSEKFDITIIEINPDKDYIYNYLEIDENIFKEKILFEETSVYTIQCDKTVSFGTLKNFVDNLQIRHSCSTRLGSGGSPIINLSNGKIIGVHCASLLRSNFNLGTLIKYPIEKFFDKFEAYIKDYINSKEQKFSKINPIIYNLENETKILDFDNNYPELMNELKLEKDKNKILQEKINKLQLLLDKYKKDSISNIILNKTNFNEILGEKKKLKALKKEILLKEKEKRNFRKEIKSKEEKNNHINNILENMCIYGNIIKKEIEEEKEKNPNHFIPIEEALKKEKDDQELFALALIATELKKIGVKAVIEKYDNKKDEEDEEEEGLTCLNFLFNGWNNKIKKYDLHFDFGEKKNDELLNNQKAYNIFKEKLKLKLSKQYNIPVDKIIITFPQRGSHHVQLIFQSEDFNNLDDEEFKNRFNNDPEYAELNYLKEIHNDLLIGECKLSKKYLDPEGNRSDDWGVDEERGNKDYYPPINWIGIGIKVIDRYDNGDNEWIGMDNTEGEWCVAYHGLCRRLPSDEVKRITRIIAKRDKLRPGEKQVYEDDDDSNHPGNKVGRGVYVTPRIEIAEKYAGNSEINGALYSTVLMLRVNPSALRYSEDEPDYWVLESDEIRPYRILYKKVGN